MITFIEFLQFLLCAVATVLLSIVFIPVMGIFFVLILIEDHWQEMSWKLKNAKV